MYRKIFIPSEVNSNIPFVIPREWYGREVEVVFFPAGLARETNKESREDRLMKLCGAWMSEKSAEDIISDIYESRTSGETRILEKV